MRTLEEIVEALKDRNLGVAISKTGISRVTVYDIAEGRNTNPTGKTLRLLSDYLDMPRHALDVKEEQSLSIGGRAALTCMSCFTRPATVTVEVAGKKTRRCDRCAAKRTASNWTKKRETVSGL